MQLPEKIRNDIYHFFVGFFMGSANVIPGVSGGTMLFIMGAFNKLIDALRQIACPDIFRLLCKRDFKGAFQRVQWRFLLVLGLGVLVSFATLAKFFVWMLEKHQQITYAFFFGLIAASIITVNRQMKKWSPGAAVSALISAAAAFAVISLVPVDTGDAWYTMILCGAICIIAMILPGLSGSFLLLILGQYERVWQAVGNVSHLHFSPQELSLLFLLALGCVIGLGAFVHLINFLMNRFYNATVAALIGFMIGSLPKIWPWQHPDPTAFVLQKGKPLPTRIIYDAPVFDRSFLLLLLCAIAGLVLVLAIEFLARGKSKNAVPPAGK